MALGLVSEVTGPFRALPRSIRIGLLLAFTVIGTSACRPESTAGGNADLAHLIPELRDMAFVLGGRFEPLFDVVSRVEVAPFFVDRFETTNEEYAEFVRSPQFVSASIHTLFAWPRGSRGVEVPRGREHHPVVRVTFADAVAYARFRQKRLPTEIEWRAAARKFPDSRYPWGQGFSSNRCNSLACRIYDTTIVGTFESGENEYGCYDFAGNVWEMVDTSPPGSPGKLILGGAFTSSPEQCIIPAPDSKPSKVLLPTELEFDVGFRCVRDLTPELIERVEYAARVGDAETKTFCEPILRTVRSWANKATVDASNASR